MLGVIKMKLIVFQAGTVYLSGQSRNVMAFGVFWDKLSP